jgi:hypothetical protein
VTDQQHRRVSRVERMQDLEELLGAGPYTAHEVGLRCGTQAAAHTLPGLAGAAGRRTEQEVDIQRRGAQRLLQ